jgi:hypothetical protein
LTSEQAIDGQSSEKYSASTLSSQYHHMLDSTHHLLHIHTHTNPHFLQHHPAHYVSSSNETLSAANNSNSQSTLTATRNHLLSPRQHIQRHQGAQKSSKASSSSISGGMYHMRYNPLRTVSATASASDPGSEFDNNNESLRVSYPMFNRKNWN